MKKGSTISKRATKLSNSFPNGWTDRVAPVHWPPRSPDPLRHVEVQDPFGLFFWGCVQHIVYAGTF